MKIYMTSMQFSLNLPRSLLAICASIGIDGSCRFFGEGVLEGVPPADRDVVGSTRIGDIARFCLKIIVINSIHIIS